MWIVFKLKENMAAYLLDINFLFFILFFFFIVITRLVSCVKHR